jgi:TrmH family RNA methyltransferase
MKATITKIFTENSQFQYIETLQRNRTKRNRAREFVVEGVRSINQAISNHWMINTLVYTRDRRLSEWAEGVIERAGAKNHFVLPISLMGKLSQKEDTSELVAIVAMPDDDLTRISLRKASLVVVLDRPNNPGNLGTVRAMLCKWMGWLSQAILSTYMIRKRYAPQLAPYSTCLLFGCHPTRD